MTETLIRVATCNEQQFNTIQQFLFDHGYEWIYSGKILNSRNEWKFIKVDKNSQTIIKTDNDKVPRYFMSKALLDFIRALPELKKQHSVSKPLGTRATGEDYACTTYDLWNTFVYDGTKEEPEMTPFEQLCRDFNYNTRISLCLEVDQFIVQSVIDKLNQMGLRCSQTKQLFENKSAKMVATYMSNTWDTYGHSQTEQIPIQKVREWLGDGFIILTDEDDQIKLEPISEETMQFPMMIEIDDTTSRGTAEFLDSLGYECIDKDEHKAFLSGVDGCICIVEKTYEYWYNSANREGNYVAKQIEVTQMLDSSQHSDLRDFLHENAPNPPEPDTFPDTLDPWEYPTPKPEGETMSAKPSMLGRIVGIGKGLSSLAGLFFLALWATKGQPMNLLPNVSWGEEWSVIGDSIITEEDQIVQFDVQNQWGETRTMVIETNEDGHLAIQLNPEYGTASEMFQRLAQKHLGFVKQVQENPRLAGREIPGPTEWNGYKIPAIWW